VAQRNDRHLATPADHPGGQLERQLTLRLASRDAQRTQVAHEAAAPTGHSQDLLLSRGAHLKLGAE
jgi:hypothetical protein